MELLYILSIFIIVGLTLTWLPSYLTLRPKYKYGTMVLTLVMLNIILIVNYVKEESH